MDATTTAPAVPVVLTAEAIRAIPAIPLNDSIAGVTHRMLWQTETSMAGVMTVRAGHHLGTHAHRLNHHHIWVVEGEVEIVGTPLVPGSYVHIPRGVEHDLDARETAGGTVFYLYLRPPD